MVKTKPLGFTAEPTEQTTVLSTFQSIQERRAPFKVFGIGMHKTGTTSLWRAMQILGFNPAIHNPGEAHFHKISNYAFANDAPIDLRYQRLHAMFPNAKFIITVREEKEWLDSALRHMKDLRIRGKGCPVPNHRAAYGIDYPGEEDLRKRYARHQWDAMTYFRRQIKLGNFKASDFLIMHICVGDGWRTLCGFLGIDVTPYLDIPFPHANSGVGKP